ncbi:hypothetical protein LCGC14_1732400 [marine sediment metagenome]|uniref:Uncharacterized protein n=1 Tax=marine sediment metagenome TaxID=412755 RepID=A0A0F9K8U7_9ZZZZ
MSGPMSYHAGLAAERQVAAQYRARGHEIAGMRWRGKGGEIDVIARDGTGFVFVEVKKSRTHARAADRVTPAQIRRVQMAALEFVGTQTAGIEPDMRFDVALVDATGMIEIRENAFL